MDKMPLKKITNIKDLEIKAYQLRQDIIKMLVNAKSGHTAGPLGMAEIFTALYFNIMNHDPKNPRSDKRDRFFLSNGHICAVLYAALAHAGYFPKKQLFTFRKLNSRLQGHPHIGDLPGIENSSGPLGQGASVAVGAAIAAKIDKKQIKIYLSLGDGECDEGQVWEAFMMAGNRKLDNLIAFIDRNNIQIDGKTDDVMNLEPLEAKLRAFNWEVISINGNDMKQILNAFAKAETLKGKPAAIIANTTAGKGVSFIENDHKWHGKPPTEEQGELALKELKEAEERIKAGK